MAASRRKSGPLSNFRSEYVEIARRVCALGATDMELAEILGCDKKTLYRWRSQQPELGEAMQVGKETANERVFLTSYRLACGWDEEEEVVQYDSQRGKWVRTTVTKRVHPDRATNMFWMKNRMGWRDKVEHTGDNGGPLQIRIVRFGEEGDD